MKAYIAGAITGNPNYQNKFKLGAEALQKEGFVVLNPATLPEGMRAGDYMKICFAMIDVADVVAFLPDWDKSRGARLEHAYCQYVSKQTMYLESMTSYKNVLRARSAEDGGG